MLKYLIVLLCMVIWYNVKYLGWVDFKGPNGPTQLADITVNDDRGNHPNMTHVLSLMICVGSRMYA